MQSKSLEIQEIEYIQHTAAAAARQQLMMSRSLSSFHQIFFSNVPGEKRTTETSGLLWSNCELYMDDIIVFGDTKEQYLKNLENVLMRLEEKGLTVNPKKCKLGYEEVEFVGHLVSKEGATMSAEKINKVLNFDTPVYQKNLKSFLGLANYFRDHIMNHSTIVEPLHQLLKHYQRGTKIKWTPEGLEAFEKIKNMIMKLPKIYFLDEEADSALSEPSVHLFTDASDVGIGAYLVQRIKNEVTGEYKDHPVGIMSQGLSGTQRRWSVPERKAYTIYAAVKKFDYLLLGRRFHIHTDHANLCYIRDSGSSKVIRWKLALQEYDFTAKYVKGADNVAADYFSRYMFDTADLPEYQACLLDAWEIPEQAYRTITKYHNHFNGHGGVERTMNLVLKNEQRWPFMREHIKHFVKTCACCQKMRTIHPVVKLKGFTTSSYEPMARLGVDTIRPFPADEQGNTHIVVVIDHFTRWIELYPVAGATGAAAAAALLFTSRHAVRASTSARPLVTSGATTAGR